MLFLASLAGCKDAERAQVASLVVRNANIVTVEESLPRASALAVRGDRIVALGSEQEVADWIAPTTEVIDARGRLVVPGFIEGHGHFFGLGETKLQLDLTGAAGWGEIVQQVAGAVRDSRPGDWIEGRGWHQSKWSEVPAGAVEGLPRHTVLSAVSPNNPVVLVHASGHSSFVNAEAMRLAGVDETTPDPAGGEIVRDSDGRPTGALRETAQDLVARVRPSEVDWNRSQRIVQLAGEECLREGITSFQDAGSPFALIDQYRRMAAEGGLPVRLWVMVRDDLAALQSRLQDYSDINGEGGGFLTVGGIKQAIDGALGSHGAWLLEPYSDLPQTSGLNTTAIADIEQAADLALEHDLQLCVHAIGDRANREALDLMARAFAKSPRPGGALRWRVEHAQHLHPAEIPRFAELGVIASMQGVHCTSDGPWVPSRIGDERAEQGAYVWRKLIDAGAVVSNGTDTPVERVSPLASFIASVTRRLPSGDVFYPSQRMTREEALRSYTLDAAYAAFEEEDKGSIRVGKLADLVMLSQDILAAPEEQLAGTRVVMTILGGEVRYRAPDDSL